MIKMKCKYCGKETTDTRLYCCDECERNTKIYLEKIAKYKNIYLALIFIPVFLMPVFNSLIYDLVIVFFLGIVLMIFPFSTPQLINIFGVRKSQKIVKVIAMALIFISLICSVMYYMS